MSGAACRQVLAGLLLTLSAPVAAFETAAAEAVGARSLPELAAAADLVALAQVKDTDYQYTRNFPSGGTAYLQVLIPYKVTRSLEDLLQVYEEGLREFECYFPDPTVFEEGRRYLVFLRFSRDVKEQYNGLEQGCALEVFVTDTNRYALRYPLTGMALDSDYRSAARPVRFADTHAVVGDDGLSPELRNAWLDAGWLERDGQGYRHTWGIDLSTARELLGAEALTRDRSLK